MGVENKTRADISTSSSYTAPPVSKIRAFRFRRGPLPKKSVDLPKIRAALLGKIREHTVKLSGALLDHFVSDMMPLRKAKP